MRAFLTGLCLFAVAGLVSAELRNADSTVNGRFKEWKNGQLVLLVGKKGEEKETAFKVKDDAKVALRHEKARMGEVPGFIASVVLHDDVPVTIGLDTNRQVTFISADLNVVFGRFKEWRDGQLILMVGPTGKEKEMSYKINDDAKVNVGQSGAQKIVLAKDSFRDLKGTEQVILTFDDNKTIRTITVDRR